MSPADGTVTVERVLAETRRYLYLPDPAHVLFALAVAVSVSFGGEPLWGLLVGAPSSGKTMALRLLDGVADSRIGEVTAAARERNK